MDKRKPVLTEGRFTVRAARSRAPRVADEGSAQAVRNAVQPKRRCLVSGTWPNKYLKATTPPAITSSPACSRSSKSSGKAFRCYYVNIVKYCLIQRFINFINLTFTKHQRALLTDRLSIDWSSRRRCHKMLTVHDFTPLTTAS